MRFLRLLSLALAFPVVLAACGSSGSKTTTSATTTASSPASTSATASGVAINTGQTSLGSVLVDGQGRTLYHLTKDTATNITCGGACATTWPPVIVPSGQKPTAGPGVTAALTAVMRADGSEQVAANGQPLYRYSGDSSAGDIHGQGVGGVWFALMANGTSAGGAATKATTATTAASSSGMGGGY